MKFNDNRWREREKKNRYDYSIPVKVFSEAQEEKDSGAIVSNALTS